MIINFFKIAFAVIKWIVVVVILLMAGVFIFTLMAPTFGGSPDAASAKKIANSKHHDGEKFVNLAPVEISTRSDKSPSIWKALVSFINPDKNKNPNQPLPTKTMQATNLANGDFIWLGHSTVLFKTAGKTLITDPVFHSAAPVSFAVQAFPMTHVPRVADLPMIDAVLISHDHYDHLDYKGIKQIKNKVRHFYVPLGIKAHLQRWGVPDDKITEMDWYESTQLGEVTLVLTPARHFSGRGLFDRFKTLWSSWVVKSPDLSVYFSGDGGYAPEFKTIGEQYGPFDMAFMEDGAYNENWAQIHMMPEEAAQAAVDLGAKVLLPIHWGKFDLSTHAWIEPVQRIAVAVDKHNETLTRQGAEPMILVTPMIGQTFTLENLPNKQWWLGVE